MLLHDFDRDKISTLLLEDVSVGKCAFEKFTGGVHMITGWFYMQCIGDSE